MTTSTWAATTTDTRDPRFERAVPQSPRERRVKPVTAQSDLAAIRRIVKNTDEHRNRARSESWDAIKSVLAGDAPAERTPEPAVEPLVEELVEETPAPAAEEVSDESEVAPDED